MNRPSFSKKALIIASMASMIDNFNRSNIEILHNLGYEITLAASFGLEDSNSQEKNKQFYDEMTAKGYKIVPIDFSRSMTNIRQQIKSYRQLKKLLKDKYDLVHCHSPICSVLTRLAYRRYRKEYNGHIIYTAHGFHFYDGAPLMNWVVFYPVEKLMSRYTDALITINREDYQRAKKNFHAKQTLYVPGVGVDTGKFSSCRIDVKAKRESIGVPADAFLLMSVGELNDNKNQAVIVRALAKLHNPAVHYAVVGMGDNHDMLLQLAGESGVSGQLHLLGYRTDVPELYRAADVCVFPSIREGLPVAVIEGMAAGLPFVASENRGTADLLTSDNSIMCRYDDDAAFCDGIRVLMENEELRRSMGQNNQEQSGKYDISVIRGMMTDIYRNM